jgi:hypothetical protein
MVTDQTNNSYEAHREVALKEKPLRTKREKENDRRSKFNHRLNSRKHRMSARHMDNKEIQWPAKEL